MKKFLIVCLLMSGCGLLEDVIVPPPWEEGDDILIEEVFEYYSLFYERYDFYVQSNIMIVTNLYPYTIPIYMDDMNGTLAGLCRTNDTNRDIRFDREQWKAASDIKRRALVFHELGHCALNREHRCSKWGLHDLPSLMSTPSPPDGVLMFPITEEPSDYWEESGINYMELELFDSQYLFINDCQ